MADNVKSTSAVKQTVSLPKEVFAVEVNNHELIKKVYQSYLANSRENYAVTKTRGLVRGGGKKPWRQKGTGRARAGMSSSPLWRGGGRIFPNSPEENFSQKVNKKMYRAGMRSILSQLAREGRLNVVDQFNLDAPKTKVLADKVKAMGLDSVLIIVDQVSENLYLASRNLHKVAVCEPQHADPLALVQYKKVLVSKAAIAKIEELLK